MKKPGSNLYIIEYRKSVLKKDIPSLSNAVRSLIKRAIEERLTIDPIGFGKPLQYSLKGYRRLRVSNYRVIYSIESTKKTVIIIAIRHRKKIYD